MKKILSISFIFIAFLSFGQVQYPNSYVSTVNSSTATLTSGSVFTGTSEDVSQYAEIRVSVKSDVASATDGLSMQQSSDGTNWDNTDFYTIPSATGKAFGVPVYSRYFRIVYTNGGTNQASFKLQTVFHKSATNASSVRPQDGRTNDNDMQEVLGYSMVYDPNSNTWNRQTQDLYFTGQAAQTATVNNIIPATVSSSATDLLGYKSGSVQIFCPAGTYTTGAVIFEGSNDNSNFQTIPVYSQLILTGTPVTAAITLVTTTSLVYTFPVTTRYVRVRISTGVTGASASVQAISVFSKSAWTPPVFQVAQATAANLNTTATIASGTVTTVTTLTTANGGPTAASSASANNPLQIGGVVVPTTIGTQDQTFVAGDVVKMPISTDAQVITKPFATAEIDWSYAAASGGISNTTTAVTFKAASGTAGIRTYVTSVDISAQALGAATEIAIRDGAAGTVLWRQQVGTSGLVPTTVTFLTPLRGTANTLMEVVTLTATVTGGVYFNAHGFTAF